LDARIGMGLECKWTACGQKVELQNENEPIIPHGVILLIEDDEEDAEVFRLALTQVGSPYRLVTVQFAKDAIKYLCRRGEYENENVYPKPSLIVLDLSLPGMSGLDFLTWARCEAPGTVPPVAVLSYSALEQDRQTTHKLGAKAYFVKSPNLDETVAMIKNLLLLNVPPLPPGEANPNPPKQL
jgi:DNA-binding response OmpR family regulator